MSDDAAIDTSQKHVEEIERLRHMLGRARDLLERVLEESHKGLPLMLRREIQAATTCECCRDASSPIETIENPIDATKGTT